MAAGSVGMNEQVAIYICLLEEGTDSWRPVQAVPIENDTYRIISENPDPEDERWQFTTGDLVRCIHKTLHDTKHRECLLAVEKIN
jgi:hypothetical protein